MKKVISLFQRNYDGDRLVRDEIVPGAEWVVAGEGTATRKWDGTCCLVKDGELFARYDAKHGKTPPEGFIPAQDPDPKTGHWPGWIEVKDQAQYRWHKEAFIDPLSDGTYELVGPKVNNNNDKFETHKLIQHGLECYPDCPRTFNELKTWFVNRDIEGVVWHHPDGRMVKIKKKDFGLKR
jgi:hypothetical protein